MAFDREALLARLRPNVDRRRLILAGAVGVALALLAVAVVVSDDGQGSRITVAAGDETTTTTEAEALPDVDIDKAEPPPITAAPDPVPSAAPAPVPARPAAPPVGETVLECLNSYDERCGEFRWTSEPGNEPLLLSVTPSSTELAVGQQLSLHIVATDADARPYMSGHTCRGGVDWGDGGGYKCSPPLCDERPRFGPWEPPVPEGGVLDVEETNVYTSPGVYQIEVWVVSGHWCSSFYGGDARQTLTVTVVDPVVAAN